MGESGSGKTLTCKAIMQILNKKTFLVTGGILFNNINLLNISHKQQQQIIGKDISMIMQNPMTAFDPMMKIGAHIIETLKAHSNLNKKQAYSLGVASLNKMNLPRVQELMNSYPHQLSGGMLQRVMIAISLMLKPSIIIADEATTALDVKNQSIILEEFKKIRNDGVGLIIVTHDFGVVAKIADEVIVMKNGEIIESGSVYRIFHHAQNNYTKELLKARFLVDEVDNAYCKESI
nr:ABC transporter ATP-binding protein [Clostridium sp. 'deep sea']